MKQPSEFVKVPRASLEALLKTALAIKTRDKTPDSPHGYAHALGMCNGAAAGMCAELTYLLEAK
jgi:hypothetical protein